MHHVKEALNGVQTVMQSEWVARKLGPCALKNRDAQRKNLHKVSTTIN